MFCPLPARAASQERRNYFSDSDTLFSSRSEQASRGRRSLFSEADMADHTDQKLTRHTLRRTELGSVPVLLNSRGEERFTPALRGALHRSLHRSAAGKARQVNPIGVPKPVRLREGWNEVRAGATPTFDARCVMGLRVTTVTSTNPRRSEVCAQSQLEQRRRKS